MSLCRSLIVTLPFIFLFFKCATPPKITDKSSTNIEPVGDQDFKLTDLPSEYSSGVEDYTFKDVKYRVQWMRCIGKKNNPFLVYFHDDRAGVNPKGLCQDWKAQVALKNNINFIAINRPGFFESTGKEDFSGGHSLSAIQSGLSVAVGSNKIVGFWGVESGVISASFASKSQKDLNWLLLGNGIYDLEIVDKTTNDERLRGLIRNQKAIDGEAMFEHRSIAWDSSGLPKRFAIYHSKSNNAIPIGQAAAFNDQLRTSQSKVFFDSIEGVGNDLPWQAHFKIVDKALDNLMSPDRESFSNKLMKNMAN